MLRSGEHQGRFHLGLVEQVDQQISLIHLFHEIHPLLDQFSRGTDAGNFHTHGVPEDSISQLQNVLWHRGREEQALPLFGKQCDDAADVVDEAHVEHRIRFIQHEELDGIEPHITLVDQIEQATRRRHQDIHTALDRLYLPHLGHSPENRGLS